MKKTLLSLSLVGCLISSAPAAVYQFTALLTGGNEIPANSSPGVGFALVHYDDVASTIEVHALFAALQGTTTAAHIHAPTAAPFSGTAGVATTTPSFAGFPAGVTSGSFSNTLSLTASGTYNPAFITANGGTVAGAESALVAALFAGRSYFNVHTTAYPGGEIRGFFTLVPEPSSFALIATGAAAVAYKVRRKQRNGA
ncbi:MAG TPA: CHRD domain-containing protein [Verrucomicrobiae bacterium]|nr:CHRD domain-containing protein [Verrucomicrobiae bacterium]